MWDYTFQYHQLNVGLYISIPPAEFRRVHFVSGQNRSVMRSIVKTSWVGEHERRLGVGVGVGGAVGASATKS
jgi:hypothetical protein